MLTLRYRGSTTIPVEAECITPDNLANKTHGEILALPLQHGNQQVPLGEFFTLDGQADDGEILLEGDCSRVKWIGAGMTSGRIVVQGNVGMHVGAEMKGGTIRVHGHATDWVGAEMRGGHLHIHGDAGHLVGAAYRGSGVGMRGGTILIDGKAGNEVGSGLRRGLIAIGGAVEDFPGVGMIAGSLFLFGPPGLRPGAGMKRGTIVCAGPAPTLLPTFRYACTYQPVFVDLYLKQLRELGFPLPNEMRRAAWKRFCGDLVGLGKGEILTLASNA